MPNVVPVSSDATNEPETEDVQQDAGSGADPDVQSDPALDDSATAEWASEGGATEEGPATGTDGS